MIVFAYSTTGSSDIKQRNKRYINIYFHIMKCLCTIFHDCIYNSVMIAYIGIEVMSVRNNQQIIAKCKRQTYWS